MRAGARDVVHSGVLVTNSGDDTVEIEYGGLVFKLVFVPGTDLLVNGTGEGKILTLTFTNFDNPLGVAWNSRVGNLKDRPLYLALFIHSIGEGPKKSRLISFTFTLE